MPSRAIVLACLTAAVACSESHSARTRRDSGAADAQRPLEDPSVDDAGLAEEDATRADGAAASDARVEGPTSPGAGSQLEPESTGTLAPLPMTGNTLRAVRADSAQVSITLRPITACAAIPRDAKAAADVTVRHRACETLGPIEVDRTDPSAVMLIVWLWRSDAACGSTELVTHRTLDLDLGWNPGDYSFAQSADAAHRTLTISPATDVCSTPSDGSCARDCDCAKGLRCVYDRDADGRCLRRCQPDCNNAFGCQHPFATVACSSDASCPPGLGCRDGRCRWVTMLSAEARHACTRHADCAPGVYCVEGASGKLGCEVPCNASAMHCPGIHYCTRDSSFSSAQWVCEWGGE